MKIKATAKSAPSPPITARRGKPCRREAAFRYPAAPHAEQASPAASPTWPQQRHASSGGTIKACPQPWQVVSDPRAGSPHREQRKLAFRRSRRSLRLSGLGSTGASSRQELNIRIIA